MKNNILVFFTIFLFCLLKNNDAFAQLSSAGKSLGFLFNQDDITIELFILEPNEPCDNIGKPWLYKIKTTNISNLKPNFNFLNWKLRVKNCNDYLIERNFSINLNLLNNAKNDGIKGNSQDWKFEAKSIEWEIIEGGLFEYQNSEPDVNLSFSQKLLPPDSIMGENYVSKGELTKLSIPKSESGQKVKWVWYLDNCGNGIPIFTGYDYLFIPTKDITLFVRAEVGNRYSECKKIEVKAFDKSIPAIEILTTDGYNEIYIGEKKTLVISGGRLGTNAKWTWYENTPKGRIYLGSNETLEVEPLKTSTYEVRAEGPFGQSDYRSITLKIIEEEPFWNDNNPFLKLNNCVNKQDVATNKKIIDLITTILEKADNKYNFQILNCENILSCKAVINNGSYLLMNPNYLNTLSSINFQELSMLDLQNLYEFSHELSYLINKTLQNEEILLGSHQIELEVEKVIGQLMFYFGVTEEQLLSCYKNNLLTENATLRIPPLHYRQEMAKLGYNDAFKRNPNKVQFKIEQTKVMPFSCGIFSVLDIEGNTYGTTLIGNQCWLKENLKVKKYRNGTSIIEEVSNAKWATLTTGAWSHYNNSENNNLIYGKLYNWHAVINPRGLCPQGWHVPSDDEWSILITSLGGESKAGGKMKVAGIEYWKAPNYKANNESQFSGLPGGNRNETGTFSNIGINSYWWSSTEINENLAWFRNINYNLNNLKKVNQGKKLGLSVRCLKDEKSPAKIVTIITLPANSIKETSVLIGGNINSEEVGSIKVRGITWSKKTQPSINQDFKTNNGLGIGTFATSVTNLIPNTTYYARAYIINNKGTIIYGNEITFKTLSNNIPLQVTTLEIIKMNINSITCGGVISVYNDNIIESGIYLSEDDYFIKGLKKIENVKKSKNFQLSIGDLTLGKTYWLKAFVKTNSGILYGQPVSIYMPDSNQEKVKETTESGSKYIDFKAPKLILSISPYFQSDGLNQYWLRNNESPPNSSQNISNIIFNNNFFTSLSFDPFVTVKESNSSYSKIYFDINFFKASYILDTKEKYYIKSKAVSSLKYPINDSRDIFLDTENYGLGLTFRHVSSFFSINVQAGAYLSNLILRFQKKQYHFSYKIPSDIENYVSSRIIFFKATNQNDLNFYSNLNIGLGWGKGLSFNFGLGFITAAFGERPNHFLFNLNYPNDPISNSNLNLIPNIKGSLTFAF
jgi:uncharacterized protein (TIGR02145 family)